MPWDCNANSNFLKEPMKIFFIALLIPLMIVAADRTDQGFIPIFNGKTLDGWLGQDMSFWSVEDGAITATITTNHKPPMNQYLVWQAGYTGDFELKMDFRLAGDSAKSANGGFQFRSRRLPNGDVAGYQVDNNRDTPWKARLYDEFGRHDLAFMGERSAFDASGKRTVEKITLEAGATDFEIFAWHEYHLIAKGPKLTLLVNGKLIAETTDNDADSYDALGLLALQLHTGPPQKAQFKNIRMKRLSPDVPAGSQAALLAEATFCWKLGARTNSHQPPLKPQGKIVAEVTRPQSKRRFARLDSAYFDVQIDLNEPRKWNMPGEAMTVWLRVRVPDGRWSAALIGKCGSQDTCNFNLYSTDLKETPGPDICFAIHTDYGFVMTSFPVAKIDATAWHDLIGRYDGKTIQILCDGKVMSKKPAIGSLTKTGEPLLIGAVSDNGKMVQPFTGEMEFAGLWTRALTDQELAAIAKGWK
jgi:hypothetical protein